jgi:hypothetical protein
MRLVTIIFIVLPIIFVGGSLIFFWVLVFIRLIFIAHGWISPACWLETTQKMAISLIVVPIFYVAASSILFWDHVFSLAHLYYGTIQILLTSYVARISTTITDQLVLFGIGSAIKFLIPSPFKLSITG